jgi:hypothetical protein
MGSDLMGKPRESLRTNCSTKRSTKCFTIALRWVSVRSLPLWRRQTHECYWRQARQNQLWSQMGQCLSSKLIREWSVKTKQDTLHNMKHFLSRKDRPSVELLMAAYVINAAFMYNEVLDYSIPTIYHIIPQFCALFKTQPQYPRSNTYL